MKHLAEDFSAAVSAPGPSLNKAAARLGLANRLFPRLYQASNLLHKTATRAVSRFG